MIKNIVFDLGSVLLKGNTKDVLNYIEITDDEYKELSTFFKYDEKLDLGLVSLDDKLSSSDIPNYLKKKYHNYLINYYEYRKIDFDLVRLLNYLNSKNYRIYVISDNNFECARYYERNLLFKNIKGWVFSCDYQSLKKDGKLFNILLNQYNLFADECYFIDDNKVNIDVAKSIGFKTFLYEDNYKELIKDLINNNVVNEDDYLWN